MQEEGPHRRSRARASLVVASPYRVRRSRLEAFAEAARRALRLRGEVSILITDSASMRALNRRYRGKNKPTDVLSFPSPAELADQTAGDLAISMEIAKQQAKSLGHSLTAELSILILHGMIHLAGYDHQTDDGEMATLERRLRRRFSLPLGLTERSHHAELKG